MDKEDQAIIILTRLREEAFLESEKLIGAHLKGDLATRDFYITRWTAYDIAISKITGINTDYKWQYDLLETIKKATDNG